MAGFSPPQNRIFFFSEVASTMYWPGMEKHIEQFVKKCKICQKNKKQKKKYGKLPAKSINLIPWDTVCVDCVGPYSVTTNTGEKLELNSMTFVDLATG